MAVLLLIAVAAIGVIVYAFMTKDPPSRAKLRLPSIDQLKGAIQGPQECPAKVYPPGALYVFERCSGSGDPIAWRACSSVTYSVDPASAPQGYQADLRQAIANLEAATRLRLVSVAAKGDIRISWDAGLFDPRPGTSGEAGVTDFQTESDLSGSHVSSADVRISAHLVPGTAPGVGEEPVLLHELGHAVGLGHVDGPVVMNPLDRGFANFQPGDLAGLTALYHPATC